MTTHSHLTLFVFDIGNVVITADHALTFHALEQDGVLPQNARRFFQNQAYKEFSRGRCSADHFYQALVATYLQTPLTYEQVVVAHDCHMFGVDSAVLDLIAQLPPSSVQFLTDTNEWQTAREQSLVDLRRYAQQIIRSHETHYLKSTPRCFAALLEHWQRPAQEILLVDDNPQIITLAQQHGLTTHLFTGAAGLAAFLQHELPLHG